MSSPESWQRILIRMPNWVGDVVMATPFLRAIRTHCPNANITIAIREYCAPVLDSSSLFDAKILLSPREEKGPVGAWRVSRIYRAHDFDAAFLLTNSLTTIMPMWLARIPARIGYQGDWRRPLLTLSRKPEMLGKKRRPIPMPRYYQHLLDLVGIEAAGAHYETPPTEEDRNLVRSSLRELGRRENLPLVGLNPGARFGASKLWDPKRFGLLARRLHTELGVQCLLLCGPGEEPLVQAIRETSGEGMLDTSAAPFSLPALRAVMEELDALVSTDSGPRHLGVAAGCPVVTLIGPTFREWTDWNLEQSRIIQHPVPCGPCHLKICPLDHACMTKITVDEVFDAVKRSLS